MNHIGYCVVECPFYYYEDKNSRSCLPCKNDCLKCDANNPSHCELCLDIGSTFSLYKVPSNNSCKDDNSSDKAIYDISEGEIILLKSNISFEESEYHIYYVQKEI